MKMNKDGCKMLYFVLGELRCLSLMLLLYNNAQIVSVFKSTNVLRPKYVVWRTIKKYMFQDKTQLFFITEWPNILPN